MKYENGLVQVGAGRMEDILNCGLRVLCFYDSAGPGEGEAFTMEEVNGDTPTGRKFFARVMHAIDPQVVQFDLLPFMEDLNPESGKPERMPMAGEFANEKCTLPPSTTDLINKGEAVAFDFPVKGEKPIWLYRGAKWVAEFSLVHLFFGPGACKEIKDGKPGVPDVILLKVQGQGGETVYRYGNGGVVGQKG